MRIWTVRYILVHGPGNGASRFFQMPAVVKAALAQIWTEIPEQIVQSVFHLAVQIPERYTPVYPSHTGNPSAVPAQNGELYYVRGRYADSQPDGQTVLCPEYD